MALLSAALAAVLAACGPTQEPEPVSPSATEAVALDAQDVVRRAQAQLPSARASSASTVISSELSVRSGFVPNSVSQIMPVVAAGNGIYLVVWTETWSHTSPNATDLFAVRVNASTGALLDSTPILVSNTSDPDVFPAVGFDGTNFLVAWTRPPLTYAVRVRASDGAVLGTPRLITTPAPSPYEPPLPHMYPAVAFDGTNYLVVWNGTFYKDGVHRNGILGTWVRPSDGQTLDTYAFIVSLRQDSTPQVAFGNGRYLVTWSDSVNSTTANVHGVRIDAASRQVLDATPLSIATSTSVAETNPSIASDGSHFLVVWQRGNSTLEGVRVRGSDGAVLSPAATVGTGSVKQAAVTYDGQDYRVGWVGNHGAGLQAFSTRVSTSGAVGEELVLSSIAATTQQEAPAIAASSAGHFLALYGQYDSAKRIRMRLVQDVQPQDCTTLEPTLVLNGTAVMNLECNPNGTYSDPGAQAFDGCGNPIPVHAYNSGNDSSGPGPNVKLEGNYTVSYSAWDAQGRTVSATRTVNVDDTTAPTLTLLGAMRMTHTCGSMWNDPGYVGSDVCYPSAATSVWRTGEVNGWAEGTYTVTYTLTDSGGNSAPALTRTVEVVDCPW
ncbi:DUF5011 domain-containing protein [Hyalangium rubrum]|uniref:DUF5011 domain-containing protein n=1 Tax=Hyalangium rubrum TaxID=3103134 RepID=A0ABU5HDU8_9BACT|nr:DUF5011 domain-containing protein [Hyalangium sp. s54d21]MDY7230275.1 DUF5011 domain-containing protein [Hyalangium sp. s54d21]